MSETRCEVWWSGKQEWAEPCKLEGKRDGMTWIDDHNGRRSVVPSDWLHPVEPEIAPGTPCYGNARHIIGYYQGKLDEGRHVLAMVSDGHMQHVVLDVEPIAQPKIDWSKIASFYGCLVRFDSGVIIAGYDPAGWQVGQEGTIGTVTEIIPRPKS